MNFIRFDGKLGNNEGENKVDLKGTKLTQITTYTKMNNNNKIKHTIKQY